MLLEITDLSKKYIRDEKEYLVLDKVSFQAEKGQLISITGKSGSGKSTFFNIVTGMLEPTAGSITMEGISITGNNRARRSLHSLNSSKSAGIRSRKIGYIMQGQNLLNNFSVLDNVCLPFYLKGRKRRTGKSAGKGITGATDISDINDVRGKAENLLREVGLYEARNAFPSELSGGEIKRAAIVRALINDPDIIIADEPTGNLDPASRQKIIRLFEEISRTGVTVIVSTHDMEFLKYSNQSYEMKNGRLEKV